MLRTSVLVFSGGKCLGIGGVTHQAPLYVFFFCVARWLLMVALHSNHR